MTQEVIDSIAETVITDKHLVETADMPTTVADTVDVMSAIGDEVDQLGLDPAQKLTAIADTASKITAETHDAGLNSRLISHDAVVARVALERRIMVNRRERLTRLLSNKLADAPDS